MRSIRLLDDTLLYLHDPGEMLSDAIARDQDYFEKEILFYLADKHHVQEVILDVGANIGNHTAYFAQYLEYSEIYCFEPVESNYNLLELNIAQFPNVEAYQRAVGDTFGVVHIQPNTTNMGASEITQDASAPAVMQIKLDQLSFMENVTLIKIDVEWYEPKVLEGARNLIKEYKPLLMVEDASGWETRGMIESMGYELEAGWPEHKTYLYRSINA